jgi:hypothetical protein
VQLVPLIMEVAALQVPATVLGVVANASPGDADRDVVGAVVAGGGELPAGGGGRGIDGVIRRLRWRELFHVMMRSCSVPAASMNAARIVSTPVAL